MTDQRIYTPSDEGRVMTSETDVVYRVQRYGVTREYDIDSREKQIAVLTEALEALAAAVEAAGATPVGAFEFTATITGTVRTLPSEVVKRTGITYLPGDIESVTLSRGPEANQ